MRLASLRTVFFAFFLVANALANAQFVVPPKPEILYPVYDQVGLLTESEKQLLNNKLIQFRDSTSVQIEVVILPTTNGEDVNFAAWQIGEKWGLRNKDVKNGVVFLIAKEDRTMSIQQGRDVEQYITASIAGQILDYLVTPYFKQGQFYNGINNGTEGIMDAVKGKFKPLGKKKEGSEGGVSIFRILLICFIIFLILSFLTRNNKGGGNYDDDDDVIISRRGRRNYPGGFFPFPGGFGGGSSGGGGFGGGFGGFGGGGGGGFGGGGASGSW